MPIITLPPESLRLTIAADGLGFADTSELVARPLPWIGQERAEKAARFGLTMEQPSYHLFVLGEVGSGRSSLLQQLMQEVAATRPVPPDLCYLHNFDAPERPRALRMPAGQGRELRQFMAQLVRTLQTEIPRRLAGPDFKAESQRLQRGHQAQEDEAFAALTAFAEARRFHLYREAGQLVFTLVNAKGHAYTENEARALPKERRAEVDRAEQELREEIARFLDTTRPMERALDESLKALRRQTVKPLLEHELQLIRVGLKKQIKDSVKLGHYLDQVMHDVLENVELFEPADADEDTRRESLEELLLCYRVNLVVDNSELQGAPVVVENNPVQRALFGGIEYQAENDMLVTDFAHVRAGSLPRAHGGFLLLHLRDLLSDEVVWEKLRRFLISGRLQIEEAGAAQSPMAAMTLSPEAIDADVKIVLVGTAEQYYAIQEGDPEFARHFRAKVDFADSFTASPDTYQASAVFVAHACQKLGLPHFSAGAVARLLENSHRDADDQTRQSAIFDRAEALVVESAAQCDLRKARLVDAQDVEAALQARTLRHDLPEQRLQESLTDGDRLIDLRGSRVGQINGLSQIDLGDYRFGFPVRVTARTFAGTQGLLNIEREVEMSGPIHDKGVLILHSYLHALFGHIAPLALNASVVFEQEYMGVEGDSASCAELYAVVSSLSGLPLLQGIAVTGAVNQHGEVLPVGGLNEKIEGWFRACEAAGLDGTHGVLIPHRNRRHLMLSHRVTQAVRQGLFQVHTATHVSDGMRLLMSTPSGLSEPDGVQPEGGYPADSVLGRAQARLLDFRRACQQASGTLPRRPRRAR